jgi:hypothetical protein
MKQLTISLAPSGAFRLHLHSHHVDIPATEAGIHLLATTIREWTEDARIATPGSPTQAQILEALKGTQWGEEKQLAGAQKRRAEIAAATGVRIRSISGAKQKQHLLADLDLRTVTQHLSKMEATIQAHVGPTTQQPPPSRPPHPGAIQAVRSCP